MITPHWYSPKVKQSFDGSEVEQTDEERGLQLVKIVKLLENSGDEAWRRDVNLLSARMYEATKLNSLYYFSGKASTGTNMLYGTNDRATWNVLRSVVQTVSSQIGRNRPRARFLTTDGNGKQKKRAKKLTTFTDGLFNETDLYTVTNQCLIDSMVFDVGCIQIYPNADRVAVQRVLPCEVFVDPTESLYGKPHTLYRRRFIDRDVANHLFGDTPEKMMAIEMAQSIDPVAEGTGTSNQIEIWEAWRIPSTGDSKDGRHCITIDCQQGILLVDEEWNKQYFPILFLRWEDCLSGFWGRSLAEQLVPIQTEINRLLKRIEQSQKLASVPRVGIQRGSKINQAQINNQVFSIIEYTTTPPVALNWNALPGEVYEQLERHVQKAYDLAGISRQVAAGQKPAGVVSGVAIRESLDVQQVRLAVFEQRWEQFHVAIAEIMVDQARDLYVENKSYEVSAPGTKLLESIDWKDVNMDEDEYIIQVYPASLLPTTPAGRLETVTQMVQQGLWTSEDAKKALNDLDVDSMVSFEDAAELNLTRVLDDIIYDGDYHSPEEYWNLDLATIMTAQYLNAAEYEKIDKDNINLLHKFMDEIQALQTRMKNKANPPAPTTPLPGVAGAPINTTLQAPPTQLP